MKTYTLINFKYKDEIHFQADDNEQATEICKREADKRGWDEKDCSCWDDSSSYDDYKWEDAE